MTNYKDMDRTIQLSFELAVLDFKEGIISADVLSELIKLYSDGDYDVIIKKHNDINKGGT